MFNIGPAELLVVLVIALLVLGPSKLPDAARQVGRALGEMRKLSSGFQAEMRDALKEPVEGKPTTSKSATSSKSASETTDTGGTLSAPRPPGDTTATSAAAVGDESGFVSSGDAGNDDTVAAVEALTKVDGANPAAGSGETDPHTYTAASGDTGAGDGAEISPPARAADPATPSPSRLDDTFTTNGVGRTDAARLPSADERADADTGTNAGVDTGDDDNKPEPGPLGASPN